MTKAELAKAPERQPTVIEFLEARKAWIKSTIPKHIDPDRLVRVAMGAIRGNPKLMRCTQDSLLNCMIQAATWGLEIGSFNSCHMVPFAQEATLIAGYQGMVDLAIRGGGITGPPLVMLVYEDEEFEVKIDSTTEKVSSVKHTPKPLSKDHTPATCLGGYALMRQTNGDVMPEFVPAKDIIKIRDKSIAKLKGKKSLLWQEFEEEGWKKTIVRRAMKRMPLKPEFAAIVSDLDRNEFRREMQADYEIHEPGTAGLLGRLKDGQTDTGQGPEQANGPGDSGPADSQEHGDSRRASVGDSGQGDGGDSPGAGEGPSLGSTTPPAFYKPDKWSANKVGTRCNDPTNGGMEISWTGSEWVPSIELGAK